MARTKRIDSAGQKDRLYCRRFQRRDAGVVGVFQVIRRRRAQFCREFCAARERKLVRMYSQTEPVTTRGGEDAPGFVGRKHVRFAKHITVLRQLFFSHAGQHFVNNQIDVSLSPGLIFFGNVVRAEKRGNVVKPGLFIQPLDCPQNLQFIFKR